MVMSSSTQFVTLTKKLGLPKVSHSCLVNNIILRKKLCEVEQFLRIRLPHTENVRTRICR